MYYGYVYITTNKINGKKYIGKRRGKFKPTYLGSGTYLQKAIKKYGKDAFEVKIIETCQSNDELNQCEIYWIDKFDATKDRNFYNIARGGEGGGKDFDAYTEKDVEKIREKYRQAQIKRFKDPNEIAKVVNYGKDNGMYGKGYLLARGRNGRAQPVNVYKNGKLVYQFDCEKDCLDYFSGLEKGLFKRSLKEREYIGELKIGKNQFYKRLKSNQKIFSDYLFIHKKDDTEITDRSNELSAS